MRGGYCWCEKFSPSSAYLPAYLYVDETDILDAVSSVPPPNCTKPALRALPILSTAAPRKPLLFLIVEEALHWFPQCWWICGWLGEAQWKAAPWSSTNSLRFHRVLHLDRAALSNAALCSAQSCYRGLGTPSLPVSVAKEFVPKPLSHPERCTKPTVEEGVSTSAPFIIDARIRSMVWYKVFELLSVVIIQPHHQVSFPSPLALPGRTSDNIVYSQQQLSIQSQYLSVVMYGDGMMLAYLSSLTSRAHHCSLQFVALDYTEFPHVRNPAPWSQ